jgi:hypothetical protein
MNKSISRCSWQRNVKIQSIYPTFNINYDIIDHAIITYSVMGCQSSLGLIDLLFRVAGRQQHSCRPAMTLGATAVVCQLSLDISRHGKW